MNIRVNGVQSSLALVLIVSVTIKVELLHRSAVFVHQAGMHFIKYIATIHNTLATTQNTLATV